ncbi:MAG: MFS transporter, partial [Deltaproteobacteria bacterium]
MRQEISSRIPGWVKFGYGGGEGSNSLIWTLFYVYFLFFLTDVVKIKPATAGFIMMIGVLWDAITDPLIGVWSDNLKWKWGRRRPLLLAVALPYGILSWLLFTDFNLGNTGTVIYFILVVIGYMTAFTFLNVPYTALAAEMTQDYDERTSLISFRTLWSMVAS